MDTGEGCLVGAAAGDLPVPAWCYSLGGNQGQQALGSFGNQAGWLLCAVFFHLPFLEVFNIRNILVHFSLLLLLVISCSFWLFCAFILVLLN